MIFWFIDLFFLSTLPSFLFISSFPPPLRLSGPFFLYNNGDCPLPVIPLHMSNDNLAKDFWQLPRSARQRPACSVGHW